MTRGLFITGTDTGVGKTYVTAAMARSLRQQGTPVRVCKPVATGAIGVGDDTRLLAEAAGQPQGEVTAFTFREPAAPPVSAQAEGKTLALPAIIEAVRACAQPGTLLLVEGVGGLLCPLTDTETVADLARALGWPLLVVARRALGTINHTLLTLEAAAARRLRVAGLIVTETQPACGLAEETAIVELRQRIACPLLAVLPHRAAGSPVPELAGVPWLELAGKSAYSD